MSHYLDQLLTAQQRAECAMHDAAAVQPKLAFTLAGRTVRTSKSARAILTQAIRGRVDYLVPQARSVARKLQAAGQ